MKIKSLKPGMEIFDVRKATGLQRFGGKYQWWRCNVVEVDVEGDKALISWNYNPAEWYHGERDLRNMRFTKPEAKG